MPARRRLLLLVGLTACPQHAPAWYDFTTADLPETTGATTAATTGVTGATSTGEAPTTTAASTSTSGADTTGSETGATSTGPPPDAAPTIDDFAVEPPELLAAGFARLELEAGGEIVAVELEHDGVTIAEATALDAFPYDFAVTSRKVCHNTKTFTVTVRDKDGLEASAQTHLFCNLPESGSEAYMAQLWGTQGSLANAVAVRPDDGVVVAGAKDGRMAVWALDASGKVEPGWPKIVHPYLNIVSYATAVALDADGAIVVGGVAKDGGALRRYTAKLDANGTTLWDDEGDAAGEEIAGVAVTSEGVAVAVGWRRTQDEPAAYDAIALGYPPEYPQDPRWERVFQKPGSDPIPDPTNELSEKFYAAAAHGDGVVVGGERAYRNDAFQVFTRALHVRYSSAGVQIGEPWTSPGDKFDHDSARGMTTTDKGFATVGWGRHTSEGSLRQLLIHEFDEGGDLLASPLEPSALAAQGEAISQDREKKFVVAGNQTQGLFSTAWVLATTGDNAPLGWEHLKESTIAKGVACGEWGKCTWVGTTWINGVSVAHVMTHHP